MGVHRWDGYVGHDVDALRILFTLSELCNKCHGPLTDNECPCPIMAARNQALEYLRRHAYDSPNLTLISPEKLRQVVELFDEYDKAWHVPASPEEQDEDGFPVFKVNPAWHQAKAIADEIIKDYERYLCQLHVQLARIRKGKRGKTDDDE